MNLKRIKSEFKRIKKMGFIPSNRSHNTGIGKTFEDYLGIIENNLKVPDFEGFEVKSHRELAKSKITLFTKSPSYPPKSNNYLRMNYGKPDSEFPDIPIIHTSFYGDRFNTYSNKYGFKLHLDRNSNRIYILIKNLLDNSIIEDSIYYKNEDIKKGTDKLKNLFVVYADTKLLDNVEYFHYTNAEIFSNFSTDKFYDFVEKGFIQYDIRIGAYKSGKNYGKTHDHGSGFRIDRVYLPELYDKYIQI